jgi:hypothetical protein
LLTVQSQLYQVALQTDAEIAKSKASVIIAEANSQSWLARNWRPIIVLMLGYIVFNNFILVPYLHTLNVPSLPIPDRLWDLIELSIGGYIAGRSLEKIVPSIADAISTKKENIK